MDYPDCTNSLRHEFEMYLNNGLMDSEEIEFFDGPLRKEMNKWMDLLEDEAIDNLFNNLQAILTMGIILYEIDEYEGLVLHALAGLHHKHQLVRHDKREDVTSEIQKFKSFLDSAVDKKRRAVPLEEIVGHEEVFWFFKTTKNRYLISNLFLCVMKDFFLEPYIKYVQSKIALYEYSLGFWQPFEDFYDKPAPYQVFWVDMMSNLVGTKLPGRVFQRMMGEID